jgi:hypothetical protein
MRPLAPLLGVLVVVLVLVPVPAAEGAPLAPRTVGAVSVSLRNGVGLARISGRGSLLGRLARGRIVATWNVTVRGFETRTSLSDTVTAYAGRGLRVYVLGGRWRVVLRGRRINVSGVVRGRLTLRGQAGTFSIEGRRYRPWPASLTVYWLAA